MGLPLVPEIDLASYATQSQGLNPQALSYIGSVFVSLTPDNVDAAFLHLQQTFGLFSTLFDVSSLSSQDDIVSLLDSGAAKVFVSESQLTQLEQVANLDKTRLVLNSSAEAVPARKAGGVSLLHNGTGRVVEANVAEDESVFARFADAKSEDVLAAAKLGATVIVPATQLTADTKISRDSIATSEIILAKVNSDRPDGLFTTLVTDERGVALGLVYSSAESVAESLRTGRGVYQSRKRGLWYKGESSGDIQELVRIGVDCDQDCLLFVVKQKGRGFCHLATSTCFGNYKGLAKLQKTLQSRKESAPEGSYTARLFNDAQLLRAKIMEEANELCEAKTKDEVAFEAADLFYFALTKCVAAGVSLEDVEQNLDAKSVKVKRRKGDAKGPWAAAVNGTSAPATNGSAATNGTTGTATKEEIKEAASIPKESSDSAGKIDGRIQMRRLYASKDSRTTIEESLRRPSQRSTDKIMGIVNPIIKDVRENGDKALLAYTHKFEKASSLTSPVLRAPFPEHLMQLSQETIDAIDVSFDNIRKFHTAQKDEKPLRVETMPGVVCSRFARPIERVGLYVPGGTAVLPSTALMLGVPAMVAGCKKIVMASPPRADGTLTPEIVYVAHKVGAESIVLAGGAQGVAAMAYGTESVSKVDKILGPGNQFVTAAKMIVSNDTSAGVAIDMPAGPSEVLVIADETSNPAFVASDLLSQAEHGDPSYQTTGPERVPQATYPK